MTCAAATAIRAVTTARIVVVAAAISGVAAALAAVIVLAPILVVAGGVSGDVVNGVASMLEVETSSVVPMAPLKSNSMGVELTKGHALGASASSCDEGLVVAVEAGDDGGDDVLVAHGAADGCKLVGVGADLGEVVRHGEGSFPEDRHVQLDLDDAGAAVGGVHLLDMRPDGPRSLQLMHLLQHLIGERGEEVAEDDLVLAKPGCILRIGSTHPLVIGVQKLGGGRKRAIDVAPGASYT